MDSGAYDALARGGGLACDPALRPRTHRRRSQQKPSICNWDRWDLIRRGCTRYEAHRLPGPRVQISLDDGMIGFTQDVMGRITGAFFEGDGEVLLTPPSEVERRSMSFFTGMAILEERFATAYFRFNDESFAELRPDLRATENKQEFRGSLGIDGEESGAAATPCGCWLLSAGCLPVKSASVSKALDREPPASAADRFLHARLQGTKLGVFDVYFDSTGHRTGSSRTSESGGERRDVLRCLDVVCPAARRNESPWRRRYDAGAGREPSTRGRSKFAVTRSRPTCCLPSKFMRERGCSVRFGMEGRGHCCSNCRDSCRSRASRSTANRSSSFIILRSKARSFRGGGMTSWP